jgi:hypothetical protein
MIDFGRSHGGVFGSSLLAVQPARARDMEKDG